MDNQKDVMRAKGKKKEGQRHALPPQIFNGDKYCGVSTEQGRAFKFRLVIMTQKVPSCIPYLRLGSLAGP